MICLLEPVVPIVSRPFLFGELSFEFKKWRGIHSNSLAEIVQRTDTKRAWNFFPPNGVMKKPGDLSTPLELGFPGGSK